MSDAQPTLARRALGIRLKAHRERIGLTPKEAADLIGYNKRTIERIEAGTHGTKKIVIEALVKRYGINVDEASHLYSLVVRGAERGWWETYVDGGTKEGTRPDFPLFLESEQVSVHIRVLETEVIPGLLQTSEYLFELQAAQLPIPSEVAGAVRSLRTLRQKLIWGRARPPRMEFLLGEGALRYLDQLPALVKETQLKRLLEAAAEPFVDIRVITQLHAGAAGAFNIITAAEEAAPFVFIDLMDGCRYVEDRDIVSMYVHAFLAARKKTIGVEEYLR
jgi:DNA-binding XRE family transcriptional regulator